METVDLNGRKGLVVGIANQHSLAWAAAQQFSSAVGELAITYLNDKAKPHVEPLARKIDAPLLLPCNVTIPAQLDAVFDAINERWGRLDFLFHSIARAQGGLTRPADRLLGGRFCRVAPGLLSLIHPHGQAC